MKKMCFLVLFLFVSSVCFSQERLGQNEKITCAFTGSAKIVLAVWGYKQNSSYGNLTGILFSLSGLRDVWYAVRKEGVK